jgi:hypothetical protein
MTVQYKVSYKFVNLPFTAIGDFTDTIITGFTGNPGLPTPPVSVMLLGAQKDDYLVKLAATAQGGTVATAMKNDAWDVLVDSLRQLAAYVQTVAGNNLTLLLSSGFTNNSTNRAQAPLTVPLVLGVDTTVPTQLTLRLQFVRNARAYEVWLKTGTGDWSSAGIFTAARAIVLTGLVSGSTVTVQVRAIGGSTGWSPWSNPVTRIIT